METDPKSPLLKLALPSWLDKDKLKLTARQQRGYQHFLDCLRTATGALAACLLDRSQKLGDPSSEMRGFADQLIKAMPAEEVTAAFSILDRVVRLRNARRKLQLPRPDVTARITDAQSPFTSQRWRHVNKARQWQEYALGEITRNQESQNSQAEHAYGRVLASAVLWGGLISRLSLERLYRLLPQWRRHCSLEHGRLAVTWTEGGSNHKRWIADPLTALLLMRLPQVPADESAMKQQTATPKKASDSGAGPALLRYFCTASLDRKHWPDDFRSLLDGALLLLEMQVPRVLTEYAAGRHTSHSLRPEVWARLMGQPREPGSSEAGLPNDNPGQVDEGDAEEEDAEPEWLPSLRQTLASEKGRGDKATALGKVVAFLEEPMEPEARIFAGFAEELLRQHAKSRSGNTLKTLQARVVAVATRLTGLLQFGDAAAMNPETLQGAYQQVLEDASSDNQRQKLAGHLRAFHKYLVRKHLVGAIDEGEAFATENEDLTVDANLIVEDEYRRAAEWLSSGQRSGAGNRPAEKQLRQAARLILMLGFRCGLRRMEVLKLQLNDLNEQHPAELLVRPWEQRRLKTPNATRKLPLHALLLEGELRELEEWKRRRQQENREAPDHSPFFFSIPGMAYLFVPESLVFPLIHDALRSATGDRTLHFHHLRHAFASWLVFALLQPPGAPHPGWLEDRPGMREWMARSRQLHASLYGNSFPTRRHLFALCRLLGHSTPSMSIEHYVHTFDQLLAQWLETQMPRLEPKTWIAVSGLPYQTVYRWLRIDAEGKAESGFWALVARRWQRLDLEERKTGNRLPVPARVRPPEPSSLSFSLSAPPSRKAGVPILEDLWLLLYLHAKDGTSVSDLARRFGLPELLVQNLIEVAVRAEALKYGKKTYLHHFETASVSKAGRRDRTSAVETETERRPVKGTRLACPGKPREQEDARTVERFVSRLWELVQKKPHLADLVLHYVLHSPRNERNGLEFQMANRKLAKQYLQFLQELGVSREEIVILHFSDATDAALWEPWRRSLALEGDPIVRPAILHAKEKALRNDIGIKVVISSGDGQKKASYGFRYLLVMAAIWVEAHAQVARAQAAQRGIPMSVERQ